MRDESFDEAAERLEAEFEQLWNGLNFAQKLLLWRDRKSFLENKRRLAEHRARSL